MPTARLEDIEQAPRVAKLSDIDGPANGATTGGVAIPGIPKPKLPYGLSPESDPQSIGGQGPEPGIPKIMVEGGRQLLRALPSFSNSWKAGASDVIEGAGKVAAPLAIPAVISAPAATALAMGGGYVGGKGTSALTKAVGGDEEAQRLANNVGGIAGGAAAAKYIPPAAGAILHGAAKFGVKRSLGLRGKDFEYGKTPDEWVLKNTSGFSPEAVRDSGRLALDQQNAGLDAILSKNPNARVDLEPARQVAAAKIQAAEGRNSQPQMDAIQPMLDRLSTTVKGRPLARYQAPPGATQIKRGLNDFTNWTPTSNKDARQVGNEIYHAVDAATDAAIPEAVGANQQISSGITAVDRANQKRMGATFLDRLLNKGTAHTGALAGTLYGLSTGNPLAAAAGFLGPELAANPSLQMALARGAYGAAPIAGRTLPPWMSGPISIPAYSPSDQQKK